MRSENTQLELQKVMAEDMKTDFNPAAIIFFIQNNGLLLVLCSVRVIHAITMCFHSNLAIF